MRRRIRRQSDVMQHNDADRFLYDMAHIQYLNDLTFTLMKTLKYGAQL